MATDFANAAALKVLIVNNVYFALPDQCVVEFNFDDGLVELHMRQTFQAIKD